jgi:hypothetical protein
MTIKTLLYCLAALSAMHLAGCAGTVPEPQSCVTGKLVYKGNAPFEALSVQMPTQLVRLGFAGDSAKALEQTLAQRQNQSVTVCGQWLTSGNAPTPPGTLVVTRLAPQ